MTSEELVLLVLGHLKEDVGKKSSSLRFPSSEEEWSTWIDCAIVQGVAPLLYYRIKMANREQALPANMLLRLREAYHQNAARNLRLFHEFNKILSILNFNHIPVIVLKGAFLASAVYPNPALRSMADLDILIRLTDIPAALVNLNELGYQPLFSPWQATDYDQILIAPDGMTMLEVHWSLTNQYTHYNNFMEDIWMRAQPQVITGINALTLAPEDLLTHLCQHAAVHHLFMQGIRPLCDVDIIVRKYSKLLNWRALSERAVAADLSRALSLTLYLCWKNLDTPIPASALKALHFGRIDPMIVKGAVKQMANGPEIQDPLPYLIVEMLGEKKFQEKVKITLKNIFRPSRVALLTQGNKWRMRKIYFQLRRSIYLIGRYSGLLIQFLQRDSDVVLQIKPQIIIQNWLKGHI